MSDPSFHIIARGSASDGVAFVTDGSLILREDALAQLAQAANITTDATCGS